jgi:hypothetical protein
MLTEHDIRHFMFTKTNPIVWKNGVVFVFEWNGWYTAHRSSLFNKLNTTLVRSKIPLHPKDAPVQCLVISPFASEKSAAAKSKMANTKKDYIIEPDKIEKTLLAFWRHVGNKPMASIECDNEILANLPRGEVSSEMHLIDEEPLPKKAKKSNAEEPTPVSPDQFDTVSDEFFGGSSLLRSREEAENVVPLSATITVGATQTTDINVHEMAANLLRSNSVASLPLRTAIASDGSVQASADEANTFVVHPSTVFASVSDEDYLEKHCQDLFPFGRGGFGEKRKYRISHKAYLSYLLNLSTLQFQHVDFLLPLYDMTTRQEVANKAFIRSKLPSRENSSGVQFLKVNYLEEFQPVP